MRPVLLGQVEALADRSLTPNTQPKLPHFQLTQQKEELFELAFYDIAAKESDTLHFFIGQVLPVVFSSAADGCCGVAVSGRRRR